MRRKHKPFTLRVITRGRSNPAGDILVADLLGGLLLRNAVQRRRAVEKSLADVVMVNTQEVEAEEIRQQIKFLEMRLKEVSQMNNRLDTQSSQDSGADVQEPVSYTSGSCTERKVRNDG